ncbi:MAG: VCBS repeat-containing protein [Verrucomicrobiaceae bacterium]|nr:VCBS repeat-containing protein [Verrucomicrobiaceae bacterium]
MFRPLLLSFVILSSAVSALAGVQRLSIGGTPPAQEASFGSLKLHHPTLDLVFLDNGSLYSLDTTTGTITPLLPVKDGWYSVEVSPDGSRLVAHAADGGIWSVPATGGTAVQLAGGVNSFVISADSMRVAYIQNGGAWSIPISGGPTVALTPTAWTAAGGEAHSIVKVPGSSLLVVEASASSSDPTRLYRVQPSGAGILTLTTNTLDIDTFKTNATGTHVLFTHERRKLASVNLSGTPVQVALHSAFGVHGIPSFESTPDGTQVVFSDENSSWLVTLFRVSVTGGSPTEVITSGLTEGLDWPDYGFLISPDGQHVVFKQDGPDYGLYVAAVAGGAALALNAKFNTQDVSGAAIAANDHVIFVDDEDGDSKDDLVAADYITGTRTLLHSGAVEDLKLSPDADHVVFITAGGDLKQVKLDGSTTQVLGAGVPFTSGLIVNAHSADTRYVGVDSLNEEVWKASLGTAGSAAVIPATAPAAPGFAQMMQVSPDGRFTAYLEPSTAYATKHDIHLASLADGSSVALTTAGAAHIYSWAPVSPFLFSDDSQWLVYWEYSAATYYRWVLYSRRLADGLTVTLSDTITSASLAAIRETQADVLFIAGGDLWRSPLDGSSPPENLTTSISDDVTFSSLSPDEDSVVIAAGESLLLVEIGSASSPVTVATFSSGWNASRSRSSFTSDGAGIIYEGYWNESLMLYDVPSASASALFNPIHEIYRWAQAGDTVIVDTWDGVGDEAHQLHAVSLNSATSTTLTAEWDRDFELGLDWLVTSNGSTVIHAVEAAGKVELYAIDTTTAATTKLNGTLAPGGNVLGFQLTPYESAVIYHADQAANGVFELFAVPVAGGTSTRISAAMTAASGVLDGWSIASSQHVLYRSHQGTPGFARLFGAPLDGAPVIELSDPALPAWSSVLEFVATPDGSKALFSADALLPGQWTLFTATVEPTVSVIADQLSLKNTPHGPLAFTVDDLETAPDDLQLTVQSSNAGLLDPNNAVLGGSGTSRTLTLTPNADAWGRTLVTLLVSDGSLTTARQFTWTVTPDANDLPTNLSLTPSSIPENQPAGTIVGYFSATDADAWDIHSYSLVSGSGDADNGLFLIQNNALRATVPFDYETRTAYSIRVRATDFVGATFEKIINITVQDLRGFSQPVTLTTREGMGRFFDAQSFIDRFTLQDGGSLTKIRIESAPMNGSLNYQLGRRDIDTAANAAQALATGDVNGDGRPDIIAVLAGSGDAVWYENGGGASPAFTRRHIASVLNQPRDVAVGDVDKDGDLDVFVAEHGANKILCFRSSGGSAPTFAPITVFSGAGGLSSLTTADIDGDTDLDVISTHPLGHRVMIHRNDGAATPGFIGSVLSTTETGAADAVVFDADLDGDLDIVSAAATSGDVAWFEQNGASFIRRAIATGLPQPASLARADINGDSRSDLVIATSGDNSVNWYQNIPPATSGAALAFMPNLVSSSLAGVTQVLATDFTGDNVPDIIACSPVDGRILGFQTFRGASVGFATHQLDKNAAGAAAVASTDFTANGRPDLVACHASANTIAWYQDERLLIGGDEVTVHELHKIRYQPHMSFTGDDAFGWRGHDGVQWSFHPSVVTLKVIAGDYWDWLVDAFGMESVSDFSESVSTWGDSADADGDGRSNLLEYAFGGDPTSGSDSGDAVATAPQTETDGTTYFHLSFIMRHSDPDLIYTPEVTADFTTWNSGPTYFQHVAPDVVLDADFTQVTYRYLVPVTSGSPAGFFRIKVERAP